MNMSNVEFLNIPLCSAPMSYLASSKWGRLLCYGHAATRWCLQRGRGCLVCTCVTEIGTDFKMYLLRKFWSNRVEFFYNTQETQTQKKWWTRILKFKFCDFWDFLIIKKASRGPLRPIWTIMVAAKLDHSRVPVTKFHQNRSTLEVEVPVRDTQTSQLVFTAGLRPQVRMPLVRGSVVRICRMMRTQHFWIRTSLLSTAAALHATIGGRLPE